MDQDVTWCGGRPSRSRPRHCRGGAQPVPKAAYRNGYRDKHNWPWPLTRHTAVNHAIAKQLRPAEGRGCKQLAAVSHTAVSHAVAKPFYCDLLRHVGLNNLHKVVTRQRRGRELNSQPASCKSNALATRPPSHLDSVPTRSVSIKHMHKNPVFISVLLREKEQINTTQSFTEG